LRRAFSPAQVADLHVRASGWFATNGLLEEAVTHAIKGQDFDQAAQLITTLPGDSLWDQGNSSLLIKWGELIPTDSLLRHPRSLISVAAAYLITGQVQPVYRLLTLCEGIESIYGEYALLKCTLVRNEGDFVQALHLAHEAGEFLPEDEHTLRAMALMQIVNNVLRLGDLERAERAILQARALVDNAIEISPNTHLQVIQIQGIVSLNRADFTKAQRLFQEGLALAEQIPGATPPMVGMIYAELGRVHYEWNELTESAAHFARAQSWAERTGISDIGIAVLVGEIQLACQRGDAAAAEPYLAKVRQFANDNRMQDVVLYADSLIALYRLRLGQLDKAIRWANASGLRLADRPDNSQRFHYQALATVRVAEYRALGVQDGLAEMLDLLQHLTRQAKAGHYQHDLIELLILQALVLDHGHDRPAARRALRQALDLGQPGSLVRTFLDAGPDLAPLLAQLEGSYAARLVQEFKREPYASEGQQAAAKMLNLTPREVEILQEIVAGLSNKEIEAKLVISRNTVRTHIKNLYSKLQVGSRAQAINKAHELGLF
jgi:LuxR family maltose regulon positive regulatory protein